MPDTGWLNFGAFTGNNLPGDVNWNNAASAQFSDDQYAQRLLSEAQSTRGLRCIGLVDPATGKAPEIPEGAAITGLAFRWERKKVQSGFHLQEVNARWVVGGALAGDAIGAPFGLTIGNTADAYEENGGEGALYGLTLARADVLGAEFGVEVRVQRGIDGGGNITYQIDHTQARVHYAPGSPPGSARGRRRQRGDWMRGHLAREAA